MLDQHLDDFEISVARRFMQRGPTCEFNEQKNSVENFHTVKDFETVDVANVRVGAEFQKSTNFFDIVPLCRTMKFRRAMFVANIEFRRRDLKMKNASY